MYNDSESNIVIGYKKHTTKVTRKDSELNAARRSGAVVSVDKKITAGSNKAHQGTDHQRIAKLDRENEVAPPAKIRPDVGRAIQSGRQKHQFSQKELALKMSEKPSVLQDYESGKATPNPQILRKLERILGIKLMGTDIGKELERPKKT